MKLLGRKHSICLTELLIPFVDSFIAGDELLGDFLKLRKRAAAPIN
jgi:hypothetical protein